MPAPSASSVSSDRDLLIALNAAPALSRAAVCRLALDLARWARWPDRSPLGGLAAALGVPGAQLARALALRGAAAGLADDERRRAERLAARLVTAVDPDYPDDLRHLDLPPPVLYLRGELPAGPAVALVGSRRADPYGREAANFFARGLAAAGVTVVSGFARGVDAAAHRGALAVPGGRTVAVLGCGLGVDYPSGHADLALDIAAGGALLTEFPCGTPPRSWHFPVRNRIIAALSAGTLVVQAAPRSGSLLTARHALDLGREVWAVPGRIFDERSLGPHALIRDGARLVHHPLDLLEDLGGLAGLSVPPAAHPPLPPLLPLSPISPISPIAEPEPARELPPGLAGALLALLPPGHRAAPEDLAERAGAPLDQVLGELLELELAGLVRRHPGPVYGAVPL